MCNKRDAGKAADGVDTRKLDHDDDNEGEPHVIRMQDSVLQLECVKVIHASDRTTYVVKARWDESGRYMFGDADPDGSAALTLFQGLDQDECMTAMHALYRVRVRLVDMLIQAENWAPAYLGVGAFLHQELSEGWPNLLYF